MTAWIFADSFSVYNVYPYNGNQLGYQASEAIRNFWDPIAIPNSNFSIETGRYAGTAGIDAWGQAQYFAKTSGNNHTIHHINISLNQESSLNPVTPQLTNYFSFYDGATAQCSIVFRNDGTIILTSGGPTGTQLVTFQYVFLQSIFYSFEFEIVINNTTGSIKIWKNGNPNIDYQANNLNTRVSGNNYANKLVVGSNTGNVYQLMQDLMWRSDPTSVPWLGDVRSYVRPASGDVQAQWTKPSSIGIDSHYFFTSYLGTGAGYAYYTTIPQIPPGGGTLTSIVIFIQAGYTGNLKCALFTCAPSPATVGVQTTAPVAGPPLAFVKSADNIINNPTPGAIVFTFTPNVALTPGAWYCIGLCTDVAASNVFYMPNSVFNAYYNSGYVDANMTYANFPPAAPKSTVTNPFQYVARVNVSNNSAVVGETLATGGSDGGYVYSATVGQNDLYNVNTASIAGNTVAVTTRGYMQRTDQSARSAAVQLKSGATIVQTATLTLDVFWSYAWRIDQVDPNTGTTWTSSAVSALQIGPVLVS